MGSVVTVVVTTWYILTFCFLPNARERVFAKSDEAWRAVEVRSPCFLFFFHRTSGPLAFFLGGTWLQGFISSPPSSCLAFIARWSSALPWPADFLRRIFRTRALALSATEEDDT